MCGIAGFFEIPGKRPISRSVLESMTNAISHRGPDDAGYFEDAGIGLGHRRLSIIDLSGGHQPLFNEDEMVCVVYNGEIYNFQALADELAAAGHSFRTRCDTEVIVHAWEEWGERCVERFRGMFAFAVFDRRRETLFLARDRLGIKPLYYAISSDGFLVFGSELKALLPFPNLDRSLDPQAVEDFFALGYIPEPRSIYRGVKKLPPGHTITARRNEWPGDPRQYWDMAFDPDPRLGEQELGEQLRAGMAEAVKIRLMSEVPLGAFLSGGVDSGGVVAMMARAQRAAVTTCTISFGERDYDESRFASMVAGRYGTNHHVRQLNADDFSLIDRLPTVYDEPFADSSAMPTYRVCEEARRHVTVALSGDGGDEVFAGYRRYRWHHYEELVRRRLGQGLRGPVFGTLGALYPKLDWGPKPLRAKSTFQALARSSAEGYFHSVSILPDGLRQKMYSDSFKRDLQGYRSADYIADLMARAPTDHHLSRAQYVDMKSYLPGDILTKVDRASMAHSLEVRVPLLDHPFVEWSGKVAPDAKLRGREGKYIFKKALEPLLPFDVLYRPKMGFAVPLAAWFRGPLRAQVKASVAGGALAESGLFDRRMLNRLVDQHVAGTRDHSQPLWALLMFAGFLEQVEGLGPGASQDQLAVGGMA